MVAGVLGAASLLAAVPAAGAAAAVSAGCTVLTSNIYQANTPTGSSLITASSSEYLSSAQKGFTSARGVTMKASTQQKSGTVPIIRMYNGRTQSFRWAAYGSSNARAATLAGFRFQRREFYALPAGGTGCIRVYRYSRGKVSQLVQQGSREAPLQAAGWVRREALFSVARPGTATAPTPVPVVTLTVVRGDLVVSTPGQVVSRMDVRGSIVVRAANVTIKNSVVRGGTNAAARLYRPLVDARAGAANLLIEDTVIAEATPSEWNASGIGGSNFTARRVNISGQVDSINITGSNVNIESSVLGKNVYYANHWQSQQSGGTHNDSVQVLRGDNITIRSNVMTGSNSLGVMAAPEWGSVRNLLVENNFIDNGECSSKFTSKGGNANSMTVRNNVFGGHQRSWKCYIVTAGGVNAAVSGNVLSNGSTPAAPSGIAGSRSSTPVGVTLGQL
ncbi:hypothetical protein ABLG96_04950 [Nakamurella sp. A5-74]|uniref:DUF5648 domain-containing protein n=1 Tax=Nakamurella sp. A5-74 TaxID=3158264 RepID=A0AAU8DS60_9ACTN